MKAEVTRKTEKEKKMIFQIPPRLTLFEKIGCYISPFYLQKNDLNHLYVIVTKKGRKRK
jgi:hypothetical protein